MDTLKTRHCAACARRFAPSEPGDYFCTLHCVLADMGEPCGSGCATCDTERARRCTEAVHALATFAHARAVADLHDTSDADGEASVLCGRAWRPIAGLGGQERGA